MLLFKHQHDRAVTSTSNQNRLPKLELSDKPLESDLHKLQGYQVKTELDKKLILGIFKKSSRKVNHN